MQAADDAREVRQVAVIDAQGKVAAHIGNKSSPVAVRHVGELGVRALNALRPPWRALHDPGWVRWNHQDHATTLPVMNPAASS
jgi:hypothetical protein